MELLFLFNILLINPLLSSIYTIYEEFGCEWVI